MRVSLFFRVNDVADQILANTVRGAIAISELEVLEDWVIAENGSI